MRRLGPIRLLADPDCVVCGLLAHIPASSRGPSLRLHIIATRPSTPRAQSPVLPGPAAHDNHPATMLIRQPLSKHMPALHVLTASPDPGAVMTAMCADQADLTSHWPDLRQPSWGGSCPSDCPGLCRESLTHPPSRPYAAPAHGRHAPVPGQRPPHTLPAADRAHATVHQQQRGPGSSCQQADANTVGAGDRVPDPLHAAKSTAGGCEGVARLIRQRGQGILAASADGEQGDQYSGCGPPPTNHRTCPLILT